VLQDKWSKERVAGEFHVHGGIVFEALDRIEVQQLQVELILDDLEIRLLLFIERRGIQGIHSRLNSVVKLTRRLNAGWTVVIQHFTEPHPVVLVISGLSR